MKNLTENNDIEYHDKQESPAVADKPARHGVMKL